jgi:hypothetical protein
LDQRAHQYEKAKDEILNDAEQTAGQQTCKPKEFRHNYPVERARVVGEVEVAWKAAQTIGSALPTPVIIDATNTAAALGEFRTLALDGYDLFLLQTARAAGVTQMISDDGDFCGVPGIVLFTSNSSVIGAARSQRKLVAR